METDFAGEHRAHDQLRAIMGVEQSACLSQIAIDCARRESKRPSNPFVRIAAASKHYAIARSRMETRRRRGQERRSLEQPTGRLEGEDAYHLSGAEEPHSSLGLPGPGKGARAHTIAEPGIGDSNAFVQTLALALLEARAVVPIELDQRWKIGPQKGAIGEYAATDDRVAPIALTANQSFADRGRIFLAIDQVRTG